MQDLAGVGKSVEAASKLAEALIKAGLAFAEPYLMKRRARAEVDANLIKQIGEIENRERVERAQQRIVQREIMRQENLESIVSLAMGQLPDNTPEQEIDDSWIQGFINLSQDSSDEQLQMLWAKILAGEYAKPGSYSKRTLHVLSTIGRREADAFQRLCSCLWKTSSEKQPILYGLNKNCTDKDLPLTMILELQAIGLLSHINDGYYVTDKGKKKAWVSYFDKKFTVRGFGDNGLILGSVLFTSTGIELAGLVVAEPSESYREQIIMYWDSQGLTVQDGFQ